MGYTRHEYGISDGGQNVQELIPAALQMLQVLCEHAIQNGWLFILTSAYRSPQHQAFIRSQWDRGFRTGLVVRPAESSAHTRGEAIDMVPEFGYPDRVQDFMGQFATMQGYIWGGNWRNPDPVHYAVKGTEREGG